MAFSEYAELVQRVRSQGVTVIPVTPPIYYSRWRLAKPDFDRYYSPNGYAISKRRSHD